MTDYCNTQEYVCRSKVPVVTDIETGKNIWIIVTLLFFFAILLFVCLRKWFTKKFCREDDGSETHYGGRYNSDEQLSQTDRDRRRKHMSN